MIVDPNVWFFKYINRISSTDFMCLHHHMTLATVMLLFKLLGYSYLSKFYAKLSKS